MKSIVLCRDLMILLTITYLSCNFTNSGEEDKNFHNFIVDSDEANVEFFWKDENKNTFGSIESLRTFVEKNGKHLRFATNGGMYQENRQPLGLFIQNQRTIIPINNKENETGNFYLKPNGIFYITTDKKASVVQTQSFVNDGRVNFATQSGPMLLIDGRINERFTPNSENFNVRNGVCVLDDSKIVFVISRNEVNLYDFAMHFKNLGCRNALYLDGYVSKMFLPEKDITETGGDFGVIIGITE